MANPKTTPTPRNQIGVSHFVIQKSLAARNGVKNCNAIGGRLKLKTGEKVSWRVRLRVSQTFILRILVSRLVRDLPRLGSFKPSVAHQDKQKNGNEEREKQKITSLSKIVRLVGQSVFEYDFDGLRGLIAKIVLGLISFRID